MQLSTINFEIVVEENHYFLESPQVRTYFDGQYLKDIVLEFDAGKLIKPEGSITGTKSEIYLGTAPKYLLEGLNRMLYAGNNQEEEEKPIEFLGCTCGIDGCWPFELTYNFNTDDKTVTFIAVGNWQLVEFYGFDYSQFPRFIVTMENLQSEIKKLELEYESLLAMQINNPTWAEEKTYDANGNVDGSYNVSTSIVTKFNNIGTDQLG